MYNGMNLLLSYLTAEKTRFAFGVPGGALAEFMRATHASKDIQFIVSKHESGGAFMADGYARVSGRLGVCVSTSGPGTTNMLTGVAVANADGVPVLAISGCTARTDVGRGAFQETSSAVVDGAAIFRNSGAFGELVSDPRALPVVLGRAIRHCWAGGGGAAFVGIPTDVGAAASDPAWAPKQRTQYRSESRGLAEETLPRAVELLARAKSPCIFVGSGARRLVHVDLLTRLAERLGAPVVTTHKAKGVFPEEHALSLKNFGVANSVWANEWLLGQNADLLLVLGSSLDEWATSSWNPKLFENRCLIQVDIEPRQVGRVVLIDHAVIGHIEPVLAAIHRRLDAIEISEEEVAGRRDAVARFKAARASTDDVELRMSEQMPLKPQRLVSDLERALPDDAILFVDSGNSTFWLLHHLTLRGTQQFHVSGVASMGYGFAASVGGKFAAPERPVIAVGGDGALLMNGCELHTAVQHGLSLVWICFNDRRLGTVRHGNRLLIGTEAYSELDSFEPPRFAESMGAQALRVDRPGQLVDALRRALAMNGPVLISVDIDPDEPPPFGNRIRGLKSQMKIETIGGLGR